MDSKNKNKKLKTIVKIIMKNKGFKKSLRVEFIYKNKSG